ncbi:hypothetical protein DINM_021956 [Dirofilaria immitis]|nr:hypothetical protein [Dirofilaria immitis]
MEIVTMMSIIIIHALFDINISKENGYVAQAKCVVVSQQRKQQNESFEEETNNTIDEKITNESMIWTTTTVPCYYCDHDGHLRDQYEEQFQIVAIENIVDGQNRWRNIIIEAMEMQQAEHYKQSFNLPYKITLEDCNNRSVNVQILKTHCSIRTCTQTFVVLYNDQPIPAEIVVSDLSLLSLSRISTRLKIPVESITSTDYTVLPIDNGKSQWWIVAVVIGVAAGIIAAGWLCLFVYYNSCGRPYTTTAEKPLIHTVLLKDKLIQTAENNNGSRYFDTQPWDAGSNKTKSLKTILSQNGSLSRMQKAVEDGAVIGVTSEAATASANNTHKQSVTSTDIDQQFDYPISIITRPKRREDLRIHKLKSLSDISVPTLKEICMEEKLHPHPIPPTVSGILEEPYKTISMEWPSSRSSANFQDY